MRRHLVLVAALLLCVAADEPPPAPGAPGADTAPAAQPPGPHPLEGFWKVRMERKVWWPFAVDGSLAVWRGPSGLRGSVTFDRMWGVDPVPITVEAPDTDRVAFVVNHSGTKVHVEGRLRDGVFTGRAHWTDANPPEISDFSAERLAPRRRFEPDSATEPFPQEHDPASVGVDPAALDRLIHYAGAADTDALVIVKDGRLVCDRTFLRPRRIVKLDAVTHSVASLAVPLLAQDGKLPAGVDTPLATWFPQWKDDARKSTITLRHVLAHTSGLSAANAYATRDRQEGPEAALEARAEHEPGSRMKYNPVAVNLLGPVVDQAAGKALDDYVEERVLRPMGITRWDWSRTAAGAISASSGLELYPADLAKLGWVAARRGRWREQQIVPAAWFDEAWKPSAAHSEVGLGWMLRRDARHEKVVQTQAALESLRASGYANAARLEPLVGKTFESRSAWWKAVAEILGKDEVRKLYEHIGHVNVAADLQGPIACAYHAGTLGQYLLVFPDRGLVVVRQRRPFAPDELSKEAAAAAVFANMLDLAFDLLP